MRVLADPHELVNLVVTGTSSEMAAVRVVSGPSLNSHELWT